MFSKHFVLNEQTLMVIEQFSEQMPGGFFICKADGSDELLYANKALCSIFGCDSLKGFKAFSGFNFRGMIHPDDYERVSSAIKAQIADGRYTLEEMECRIIRRDGETRWIDGHGHYAKSDVYRGLFYVFISDITDRHNQAESDKAMRSAVIEALTQVYDSVWLIDNMETQHFELYRIDENLVHLMPAIAANHLDDRERVADCLKKITESSNHLLGLINEVLDMNKIESGKIELMEEEFNLAELIDTMLTIIIFSAYDWSDIEDEAREAGASAFVSKPLFRTKLAALFDSLVNKSAGQDEADAPLRELEDLDLSGRRVLLAEDQEINAEIATDFLTMTGLEVDWAKDGEEEVEMLAASPDGYYALILSDIQMPNMNGHEAARRIRAMDRAYAKQIPIVAMLANAFADDIQNSKNAGMNDHITKPIDIDALARVLQTYIK